MLSYVQEGGSDKKFEGLMEKKWTSVVRLQRKVINIILVRRPDTLSIANYRCVHHPKFYLKKLSRSIFHLCYVYILCVKIHRRR